jgi:exodeoxyribonuclease X-like protein
MTEHEELALAAPAGATVAYKGWVTTATGREAIEIVLPLGAPPALLDQAIEQWQQMRAAAQEATRQASVPPTDPRAVVVTFGKYQGKTIGEIAQLDLSYVEWMSQAARDATVRLAAMDVIKTSPARPAGQLDQPPAPAPAQGADLPF